MFILFKPLDLHGDHYFVAASNMCIRRWLDIQTTQLRSFVDKKNFYIWIWIHLCLGEPRTPLWAGLLIERTWNPYSASTVSPLLFNHKVMKYYLWFSFVIVKFIHNRRVLYSMQDGRKVLLRTFAYYHVLLGTHSLFVCSPV